MSEVPTNRIGYKWTPITDLPENWQSLCNPELSSLASVWTEQHEQLKQSKAVQEFNERLLREWSIETGILERLYTIDRGVTQLLVEQGIDAALIPHGATDRPVTEVVNILRDHRTALEGLFDFIGQRRHLTTSYVRQLHQVITRSQQYSENVDQFGNLVHFELLRGEWKKWPNNPKRPDGLEHEYCPPVQVAGDMERLVAFFQSHTDVPPEINAAWLHHRFTEIHPFQDGNGRVARALATLVFLQAGWFPLVISRNQRSEYITALEAADAGDLKPLITLFGQNAKRSFARALTLSEDVLKAETALPKVVDDLVSLYRTRRRAREEAYQGVEALADQLSQETYSFLREVAQGLRQKFAASPRPIVRVYRNSPANSYYYTKEIVDIAKEFNYWANVTRRRIWVRLHLFDPFDLSRTQLVFSFHYIGKINRGVMACTSFVFFPESKPDVKTEPDEGIEPQFGEEIEPKFGEEEIEPQFGEEEVEAEIEPRFGEAHRICREPFYFSYRDKSQCDTLKVEFGKWVSDAVTIGLAEYAQRL